MPPIVGDVLSSSGEPLDRQTRLFMESRLGHDFGDVRVHADAMAAESARAVNARAYAVGCDVVFATGQYAPETDAGRRLLSHELTHVLQQRGVPRPIAPNYVGSPDDACEREAEQASQLMSVATAVRTDSAALQRSPAVGYTVHSLTRNGGMLDDPSEDGAGNVSWPLSFAVTSPLEAEADVEITGGPGDTCTSHEAGWLQTVHKHWLHLYYWGQSVGHGSTIVRYGVPLPIRDGDPGVMWYSALAHAAPGGCNAHVTVSLQDYPTLFMVPKVRTNSVTGHPNHLAGVSRGIHFVATLVGSGPSGVQPLRFFYWNYLMDIEFQPNFASPGAPWPFTWKKNTANLGKVLTGGSSTEPLFATATTPYNASLTPTVTERT